VRRVFVIAVLFFAVSHSLLAQTWPVPNICKEKKLPTFEQYPAEPAYEGKLGHAILATRLDRKYQTRIREVVSSGANFAGHFAIASWGCGMDCVDFVMIDVKSGAVFDPLAYEIGYHFPRLEYFTNPEDQYYGGLDWWCYYPDLISYRLDSRLLIIEGCLLDGKQCGRTYFVEARGRLRQVRFDPDLLSNGKVAPF
jgi:hypothetical protein